MIMDIGKKMEVIYYDLMKRGMSLIIKNPYQMAVSSQKN
jgi:hypothetical protein